MTNRIGGSVEGSLEPRGRAMKAYTIEHLFNEPYHRVVIATSFLNSFDQLTDIEKELSDFHGSVLFDLLLAVGPNSNRFLDVMFDGAQFVISTIKPVSVLDAKIHAFLTKFYSENRGVLEASVLSRFDQLRLRKGKLLV